jgi:uncharacterized protein
MILPGSAFAGVAEHPGGVCGPRSGRRRQKSVEKLEINFVSRLNQVIQRVPARFLLATALVSFAFLAAGTVAAFAQNAGGGDFGPSDAVQSAPAVGHIDLNPPGEHDFILDQAGLLTDADKQKIKQIADKLLKDKAAPIIVVTIDSMAKHGGAGMRIETFARLLFDQWQVGPVKVGTTPWNYGMLLLVSKGDRRARIELGAGWRHDKDVQAEQIMDQQIIPRFKADDFSGGIVAGVESLDKLARDLKLPSPPRSKGQDVVFAVVLGLGVFTVVSLIRRGSGGWAWIFWAAVLGIVGAILYQMATSSSRGGGGGGFSGGSFGGGFSGGGGASGSW